MVPGIRKLYNDQFSDERYRRYVQELSDVFPGHLEFRIAETPVFVASEFTKKMLEACEYIIDVVSAPEYLQASDKAIPSHLRVPAQDAFPQFIAFDFGVCLGANGNLEPQLIELQGFPSMFAWQVIQPEVHHRNFWWPENATPFLSGLNKESYINLLRSIILGDCAPEQVILLEVLPQEQKTRVDFMATEQFLGIETVCITDLMQEGKDLYYRNKKGKRIQVKRIYNRVIFDDLYRQAPEIQEKGRIFQEALNVSWVPHPNWFYRISKFTLPFLRHRYVPATDFLNSCPLPPDLENYVVKPLFSFAGQGVIIDVTKEAVGAIKDPENWIIQKKVVYANAIETPAEPAKAEIRIFYFLDPKRKKLIPANNLARLSKGKMIGVRYNQDKEWVGGSFCLFV